MDIMAIVVKIIILLIFCLYYFTVVIIDLIFSFMYNDKKRITDGQVILLLQLCFCLMGTVLLLSICKDLYFIYNYHQGLNINNQIINYENYLLKCKIKISPYLKNTFFNIIHDKNCSICLENMENVDDVTLLLCGHFFHTECILKSYETSDNCPYCRNKICELVLNNLENINVIRDDENEENRNEENRNGVVVYNNMLQQLLI